MAMKYGLMETWRPRPEWFALSAEEKEKFIESIRENVDTLEKRGNKLLGIYWTMPTSSWDGMAFWECPDAESMEAVAEGSFSHDWYRYFEGSNIAGRVQNFEQWAAHVTQRK